MTEAPLALDVPSVAQLLGVSKRTIEHLIASGELASFRIGRIRRVRRVDVELFLESKVAAELEAADLQVVPVAAEAISLLRGKNNGLGVHPRVEEVTGPRAESRSSQKTDPLAPYRTRRRSRWPHDDV